MTAMGVLKYLVALIIFQQSALVFASVTPKDTVLRRGIIMKMYKKAEAGTFLEEVTIDGVTYQKAGVQREKDIEEGRVLALLQRYVQPTNPNNGFDFLVLTKMTGSDVGTFITGAKLIELKNDDDMDDAIIEMSDPPGLEFVMVNGKCSFIKKDQVEIWKTYDCSKDNYVAYSL